MNLQKEIYIFRKTFSFWRNLRKKNDFLDWQMHYAPHLQVYKNCHLGEDCFILGNGPSLNKVDLELLNDHYIFGTNKIYKIFDKVDLHLSYHLSVNPPMIEQSRDVLEKGIGCPSFLSYSASKDVIADKTHILRFYTKGAPWIFTGDLLHPITEGYTVTSVALQLAYFMGFKRVFLLGVDHNYIQNGKPNSIQQVNGIDPNHFIADYVTGGQDWYLADLEASEISYKQALYAYKKDNREIFDCTIGGKLAIFPKLELSEALKIMKQK